MAILQSVIRAFHGKRAYGAAGEFDSVARAARCTDLTNNGKRDVLGGDAMTKLALDRNLHRFCFFHQQALRREHVLHLRSADTKSKTGERTVRTGMRITAYHRHAGQRGALLRADYVNDTLAQVIHPEFGNTQFLAILVERLHLKTRYGVADAVAHAGWWARYDQPRPESNPAATACAQPASTLRMPADW